jgi:hypothetical protein
MRRVVHQPESEIPKVQDETFFFDGFDYITKKDQEIKDVEHPCTSYDYSLFTSDNTIRVMVIWLMKGRNIVRYLAIDFCYDVYLMSDTGKTIERIN